MQLNHCTLSTNFAASLLRQRIAAAYDFLTYDNDVLSFNSHGCTVFCSPLWDGAQCITVYVIGDNGRIIGNVLDIDFSLSCDPQRDVAKFAAHLPAIMAHAEHAIAGGAA